MTLKKKVIYYAICAVLVCLGFWYVRVHTRKVSGQISSQTLAPDVQEKLIISQALHSIISIKRTGGDVKTSTSYLPRRAAIEIGEDGNVKVIAPQWGTELAPQFGLAYSDKARLSLGVGVFYWRNMELVPFLGVGLSKFDARLGVAVSYNVWSNTHLFVGIQTDKTPVGGVSFNF